MLCKGQMPSKQSWQNDLHPSEKIVSKDCEYNKESAHAMSSSQACAAICTRKHVGPVGHQRNSYLAPALVHQQQSKTKFLAISEYLNYCRITYLICTYTIQ
eukprot:1145819-Pelagomonas_calceolata.AAC.7